MAWVSLGSFLLFLEQEKVVMGAGQLCGLAQMCPTASAGQEEKLVELT